MLSHVTLGTGDLARAVAFYGPLMERLGHRLRRHDPDTGWAIWQQPGIARPLFVVMRPFDGAPAAPGNGQMTALLAQDRTTVDDCHRLALAAGGQDAGAPGLRPQYHPDFYGAYVRDPDGNKLCICCHAAPAKDA
ncbi:VOC family protein [Methylobrevis pamukkalensis]|uniref:Glyoxalase-like domain protein n=1 Tax=Methylobrevis pamukkalensis TaxID=1439726 RepID=A0A1E3H449_9HYPH|nr:VOC family protein [Methylobrevis pamukkalensis]ODN70301.1 Glyoxalase-like domain protein [Methylobrevis pamukkalensis]